MKLNILKYALAALPLVTFSACMDFDTPSDEFNKETDVTLRPEPLHGDADNLEIKDVVAEEDFPEIKKALKNDLDMLITAQYYLMGGKNGEEPGAHQW